MITNLDNTQKKFIYTKSLPPFSNLVCDFLGDFSENLKRNKKANKFSDLMAAAFWCRKNNIISKKKFYLDSFNRVGLGVVFHVPPSNIEINFLYTFIFGLLSGNSNIIRLSKKKGKRTHLILNILNKTFKKKKYLFLKNNNSFIEYDKNDEISGKISLISDARMIWGGDQTINYFKKFETHPRCRDIMFSDRYSLAILNSDKINLANDSEMYKLSQNFFNDTYLNDQMSCSSPHLILWLGKKINKAKDKFWNNLEKYVKKKYSLLDNTAIQKYTHFLNFCALYKDDIKEFKTHKNYIHRVELKKMIKNIDKFKSFGGFFIESNINKISDIKNIVNKNFQTLSYYGFEKKILKNKIKFNEFKGIDRVVPIGQTLDIDLAWDGFDIIKQLTRVVEVK